ncbi:transposase [Bariatricus massiliensis]|uniref:Transposase n=1 Tax=Bariatricus massiliensis TaxID=1745713 RepID=A0ABS8DI17_9FIRM|nr:transposase [Bariatricus massiliensis]MCB7304634.1 transposase [Bariatricus massiliensis]MCB7374785.1 transposase [Bariatricus massiliensis]MCB7388088.1 transposase [Bariatricus massiliensis]MCB7411950.1 transposase [Bariatricus massiliensis]MCQ5254259.1 transposase [Bariatricus massiliensis]
MESKTYYATTTKRFILRTKHQDWLVETQIFYNEILAFYYNLYLKMSDFHEEGGQRVMRELEKLTIVGRDKQEVLYPLPWCKVPLYFRRAAINAAIAAGKSYLSRDEQQQRTQTFTKSVTFYKGMYRNLNEKSVELKVWSGEMWTWLHCRISGNVFSKGEEQLSPSVVLKEKQAELHVPVKSVVSDGRKAKLRIQDQEKIAAVQFINRDRLAIIAILDAKGNQCAVHFLKGGTVYERQCQKILTAIEKSEKATGYEESHHSNKKYWMKLKHLNEYYSHKFSKDIVEYCNEQQAGILVLPLYSKTYTKYVMNAVGNWSVLHLSGQIREKLKYKAWKSGIIVLETEAAGISSKCAVCGQKIQKNGTEYICKEGHRGSRYLNSAVNLGRKCLKSFEKQAV